MEMLGPERFQEFPTHSYFLLSRDILIIQAATKRKRLFLEREEWKTVPWALHPETKTRLNYLQDITVEFTGYFEEVVNHLNSSRTITTSVTPDPMISTPNLTLCTQGVLTHFTSREIILNRLLRALQSVFRWRWSWELENPHCVFLVPTNSSSSLTLDSRGRPLYTHVYFYTSLELANEILTYNTAIGVLNHSACLLGEYSLIKLAIETLPVSDWENFAPKDYQRTNPLELPHSDLRIEDVTTEMIKTVEYCLLDHQAQAGAYILIPALRGLYLAMSIMKQQQELKFICRILERISHFDGFAISGHLTGLRIIGTDRLVEGIDPELEVDPLELQPTPASPTDSRGAGSKAAFKAGDSSGGSEAMSLLSGPTSGELAYRQVNAAVVEPQPAGFDPT